ncbi:MAG: nucleotidyltransferase domain-containing protein [Candidatus Sumerlaeota bacterium]|nr:nucleotidyltransferase domain-containing protein [Candidatus Sumerlaeota bacterium]
MNTSAQRALNSFLENCRKSLAVECVILFGSRARGDAEDRSDIDLAVAAPDVSARQWREIEQWTQETPSLTKIDLARLDAIGEKFRAKILDEGVVLYERRKTKPKPEKSGARA